MGKNGRLISILSLILSLPFIIWGMLTVTSYFSKAAVTKANIVVDVNSTQGTIPGNWLAFAQGGEEVEGMLTGTVNLMRLLKPKYIRLDHIFDHYDVVREDGIYNFEKLDKSVNDILAMGAKPLFALSYMPRQFTDGKSVIDTPKNWTLWQNLVRGTIEHYSGKANRNLTDVYYEVWNEPDLAQFGGFRLSGEKNYNTLYYYAARGASNAENTNKFYFGGPAVGSYYPTWVNNFLAFAQENNLRLDFYSWHRYNSDSSKFREDALNIRKILQKFPAYANLPLVLSEWGIDSEKNLNSNSDKAAAHALATVFKIQDVVDLSMAFEVKDGPPAGGGKWGLITHETDVAPLSLKPRYKAFSASTFLSGAELKVSGWGTYVQAMASREKDETINILLSNYDWRETNWENVPVTITGVQPGLYKIISRNITANSTSVGEISVINGQIKREVVMLPNTIHLLTIAKSGNVSEYAAGTSKSPEDRALVLANNNNLILFPVFFDLPSGSSISFDIKVFWEINQTGIPRQETSEIDILRLNSQTENGGQQTVTFKKINTKNKDFLVISVSNKSGEQRFALPADIIIDRGWHKIAISFEKEKFALTIDETRYEQIIPAEFTVANITGINFYPFNGAIDNLEIKTPSQILFQQNFD